MESICIFGFVLFDFVRWATALFRGGAACPPPRPPLGVFHSFIAAALWGWLPLDFKGVWGLAPPGPLVLSVVTLYLVHTSAGLVGIEGRMLEVC